MTAGSGVGGTGGSPTATVLPSASVPVSGSTASGTETTIGGATDSTTSAAGSAAAAGVEVDVEAGVGGTGALPTATVAPSGPTAGSLATGSSTVSTYSSAISVGLNRCGATAWVNEARSACTSSTGARRGTELATVSVGPGSARPTPALTCVISSASTTTGGSV
ncbi:MAG: hypothetical protein R2697_06615 [Ilumatobacteraceae bacterium]